LKRRKSSHMASGLMRFYDQGQGNLLEGLKQPLRGGMGRCSLGITRIQPRQGRAFLGQLTTHHKLQQGQDAQRQRQQPHQARSMVVALNIHGRERQRMSLQAAEVALHQLLVPVGLDCLGQRESVSSLVPRVPAPPTFPPPPSHPSPFSPPPSLTPSFLPSTL